MEYNDITGGGKNGVAGGGYPGSVTAAPALPPKTPAEIAAETVRVALLAIEQQLKDAKEAQAAIPFAPNEDRAEVMANLTLAYRHVEDARMRLGKVFQALNGGVSNNTR